MIRSMRFAALPAAALLVASAGLAQPATQPEQQPRFDQERFDQDRFDQDRFGQDQERIEQPGMAVDQPWGRVARGGDVIGATVLDVNNENVGTINDLIIDPQAGEVQYIILAHGGFLGIGAEHIAIPWQALEHAPDRDRTYQLNITQERLEQAPSFQEDDWPILERPGWFEQTDEFFGTTRQDGVQRGTRGTGGWGMQGRVQQDWERGQETNISGTISNIDRQAPHDDVDEGLVITVQAADGEERLVHLGPVWYLEGQVTELQEGQHVEIEAREIPADDRVIVLAQEVRLEQRTMALRDQDGRPAWDAVQRDRILAIPEEPDHDLDPEPHEPGFDDPQQFDDPQRFDDPQQDEPFEQPGMRDPHLDDPHRQQDVRDPAHMPPPRDDAAHALVRGSDVRGSNVRSWEEENIGTVNELAIDVNTGRVPFIIAGFGGFLGIGEEEVVLPWQAMTFLTHEDRFMLAVNEELLRTAPRLQRDQLAQLEDPMFRQQVYSHFGMDPAFAMYEDPQMPDLHARQPWAADGQLQQLFTEGQEVEIRGTVTSVGRGEILPGTAESVFVAIRDREGQEHIVQLGPAWFLERQDLMVQAGEEIGIEGRQVDIEGRPLVLASQVRTTQLGMWLRDDEGRPRWDAQRHLGIEEPRLDHEEEDPFHMDEPDDPMQPEQPGQPDQPDSPAGGY